MDEPITEGRWQSRAHGGEIRVMAVVEGWVVARHKGAAPFLCHSSDWAKLYERK
jgi:Fe-S cluster biogenesis protein NfuA